MEIIDGASHRVLAYIEAVNRQGHVLTAAQVEAYGKNWKRASTADFEGGPWASLSRAMEMINYTYRSTVVEGYVEFFVRLQWVVLGSTKTVQITKLGEAVLREANSPRPEGESTSTVEIVIDPDNQFAYSQLMSKIGSLDDCLVVDPYLDHDQLVTLAGFAGVTRILTGDKSLARKKPAFALVLKAAPHLSIRIAEQKLLHDRYVIPKDGSALMLGSSLNSITKRFGVVTTIERSISTKIAQNYDDIWSQAAAIEPEPDKSVTEDGQSK